MEFAPFVRIPLSLEDGLITWRTITSCEFESPTVFLRNQEGSDASTCLPGLAAVLCTISTCDFCVFSTFDACFTERNLHAETEEQYI